MARTGPPRIAVLGAGPVGLEAALYAVSLEPAGHGLRARPGRRQPPPVGPRPPVQPLRHELTPLGRATLRADSPRGKLPADGDLLTGHEHLAAYLEPLAASPVLRGRLVPTTDGRRSRPARLPQGRRRRRPQTRPAAVPPAAARRRRARSASRRPTWSSTAPAPTATPGTSATAASPRSARPRPAAHIAYGLEDVLGKRSDALRRPARPSSSAAATRRRRRSASWRRWPRSTPRPGCLAGARAGTQPIRRVVNDPLRERDLLAGRANMLATRGEGNVEFHPQAVVEAVEGRAKDGASWSRRRRGGRPMSWEVERVIANVGYTPDTRLYRELQVHECYASLGPMAWRRRC